MLHQNNPSLLSQLGSRARSMRHAPTPSEARLWNSLRMRKLGVRFRRQHPLAPYVVDFYCSAFTLVVEVDGQYHFDADQVLRDQRRDTELVRLYRVRILRLPAALVMCNLGAALVLVRGACRGSFQGF